MTISIKLFGNNNYWNAGPSGGDVLPNQVEVLAVSNASTMHVIVYLPDGLVRAVFQGNFVYDGAPSAMDRVSGTLTKADYFRNDVLFQQDLFTTAADLQQWIFPSTTVFMQLTP